MINLHKKGQSSSATDSPWAAGLLATSVTGRMGNGIYVITVDEVGVGRMRNDHATHGLLLRHGHFVVSQPGIVCAGEIYRYTVLFGLTLRNGRFIGVFVIMCGVHGVVFPDGIRLSLRYNRCRKSGKAGEGNK